MVRMSRNPPTASATGCASQAGTDRPPRVCAVASAAGEVTPVDSMGAMPLDRVGKPVPCPRRCSPQPVPRPHSPARGLQLSPVTTSGTFSGESAVWREHRQWPAQLGFGRCSSSLDPAPVASPPAPPHAVNPKNRASNWRRFTATWLAPLAVFAPLRHFASCGARTGRSAPPSLALGRCSRPLAVARSSLRCSLTGPRRSHWSP